MGKIKGKLIKKTAEELRRRGVKFSTNFDGNKRILGNTMPSKKMRNQIAGYLVTLEKREKAAN